MQCETGDILEPGEHQSIMYVADRGIINQNGIGRKQ